MTDARGQAALLMLTRVIALSAICILVIAAIGIAFDPSPARDWWIAAITKAQGVGAGGLYGVYVAQAIWKGE